MVSIASLRPFLPFVRLIWVNASYARIGMERIEAALLQAPSSVMRSTSRSRQTLLFRCWREERGFTKEKCYERIVTTFLVASLTAIEHKGSDDYLAYIELRWFGMLLLFSLCTFASSRSSFLLGSLPLAHLLFHFVVPKVILPIPLPSVQTYSCRIRSVSLLLPRLRSGRCVRQHLWITDAKDGEIMLLLPPPLDHDHVVAKASACSTIQGRS